jgi:Flp pilus assembly protein TadD
LAVLTVGCAGTGESEGTAESLDEVLQEERRGSIDVPAALGEVQIAVDERRYVEATQILARVLRANPEEAEALYLLGEVNLARGQFANALNLFKRVEGEPGLRARALQGIGISQLRLEAMDEAYRALEAATTADPSLVRAWNALGIYHDSQGNWSKAEEAYGRALELAPKDADVRNNRGYSLLAQGRFSEAEREFEQAIALDPEAAVARTNLRLTMAWQGRYREAAFGLAAQERAAMLNNIGYIAMMRGDFAEAEAYLAQSMETSASFYEPASKNLELLEHMRAGAEAGATP